MIFYFENKPALFFFCLSFIEHPFVWIEAIYFNKRKTEKKRVYESYKILNGNYIVDFILLNILLCW